MEKITFHERELHATTQGGIKYLFCCEVSRVFGLDDVTASTLRRARQLAGPETANQNAPAQLLAELKATGVATTSATRAVMIPLPVVEDMLSWLQERGHLPESPVETQQATAVAPSPSKV